MALTKAPITCATGKKNPSLLFAVLAAESITKSVSILRGVERVLFMACFDVFFRGLHNEENMAFICFFMLQKLLSDHLEYPCSKDATKEESAPLFLLDLEGEAPVSFMRHKITEVINNKNLSVSEALKKMGTSHQKLIEAPVEKLLYFLLRLDNTIEVRVKGHGICSTYNKRNLTHGWAPHTSEIRKHFNITEFEF